MKKILLLSVLSVIALFTFASNSGSLLNVQDDSKTFTPKSDGRDYVEPLITTVWGQGKYFNQYCPININGGTSDYRSLVGSEALTMASILNYHRYPESGEGGRDYHPYGSSDPLRANVQFYANIYNYDMITDSLNGNYNGELAKLLYHCGVSLANQYGASQTATDYSLVPTALSTFWKYSSNIATDARDNYGADSSWVNVLKKELNARRPIYYTGTTKDDPTVFRAWIIDGYIDVDTNTYFHVNWGQEGANNGFFDISAMTPDGSTFYSSNMRAFTGVVPADSSATVKPTSGDVTLNAVAGIITDGSGAQKYQKNTNRKWTVEAPGAKGYIISYSKVKLVNGSAQLIINDAQGAPKNIVNDDYLMPGCFDNAGVSVDFGGDKQSLPPAFYVEGKSFTVEFTSDNNDNTNYGFVINYKAVFEEDETCTSTGTPIVTPTGNIQIENYRAQSACEWVLEPVLENSDVIGGMEVTFDKFDLKAGDFVDIYTYDDPSMPVFVYRFDINNIPLVGTTYPAVCSKMLVKFASDNLLNGEGFKMNYKTIKAGVGIDNPSGIKNLNIFPNPVKNVLNVTLNTEISGNIIFNITDITGKLMYSEMVNHIGGGMQFTTNVNNLAKGFYLLRVQTSQGEVTKKFIVE